MAWDSPTQHSPSFRSLQHRDQSPMTQEPLRVHTALALSPAWNSRHVPVKLQRRLSPVAPLRGSDPCASFPNPQHASSQQLCLLPKLLQPYPTRHQLPPAPGGFCVGGGCPKGHPCSWDCGCPWQRPSGQDLGEDKAAPSWVRGGGCPGCFLVAKTEEWDVPASPLRQRGENPSRHRLCHRVVGVRTTRSRAVGRCGARAGSGADGNSGAAQRALGARVPGAERVQGVWVYPGSGHWALAAASAD